MGNKIYKIFWGRSSHRPGKPWNLYFCLALVNPGTIHFCGCMSHDVVLEYKHELISSQIYCLIIIKPTRAISIANTPTLLGVNHK